MTVVARREWPVLASLAGYRANWLVPDAVAGLTLAAVAIPEQMATARLGGFPPQFGFFAFIAGTLGFCLFGSNRFVSVGADSTITPIFAGALALLATTATPQYFTLAAALALMVGAIVTLAGALRMGWIANLLSLPVTIGFLAGIGVHIIASQLPGALGLATGAGGVAHRLAAVWAAAAAFNPYALAIAVAVLALTAGAHRLSARLPGALAAMVFATFVVAIWRLDTHGLAILGKVAGGFPMPTVPAMGLGALLKLAPLAFLIALVVMVQTAATARAFPSDPEAPARLNRDYIGVGIGNLIASFVGALPVNASPPRTAIAGEAGARSQLTGLFSVGVVALVVAVGTGLLTKIPQAALSGVLLFIALRIIRIGQMAAVAKASSVEFMLIVVTAAAIIFLPIEIGVAVGIGLSLMHGMWSSARPRRFTMQRLPGSTVWWPQDGAVVGETLAGVAVLGFQAPLSFLNAYQFRDQFSDALNAPGAPLRLVVLEAAGVIDIDFTAAQVFKDLIGLCRDAGATLAIARLEAVEAQRALTAFGLRDLIGADHIFASVADAISALAPRATVVGA